MPTVPPQCVPVDSSYSPLPAVSALSEAALFGADERIAGPTPDPDTDDVVLVPVEQGNAVSQELPEDAPPQTSVKPGRIDLGNLNLHSPSSIVGTPFDSSPRFEYPFPPATCSPPFPSLFEFDPLMPSFPYAALSAAPPVVPPVSIPGYPLPSIASFVSLPGRARTETRSGFSPTHPRLQPRDPPVPPSLVKKRRLNHNQPSAPEAAPQPAKTGPAVARPRAGSLSSLPEQLQRFAMTERGQDRGRGEDARVDRCQGEKDRSQSLDVRRRRVPLERHPSDVTVVDHTDSGAKPPLKHASSSKTLVHTDSLDDSQAAKEFVHVSSPHTSPDTAAIPLSASPPPSSLGSPRS